MPGEEDGVAGCEGVAETDATWLPPPWEQAVRANAMTATNTTQRLITSSQRRRLPKVSSEQAPRTGRGGRRNSRAWRRTGVHRGCFHRVDRPDRPLEGRNLVVGQAGRPRVLEGRAEQH